MMVSRVEVKDDEGIERNEEEKEMQRNEIKHMHLLQVSRSGPELRGFRKELQRVFRYEYSKQP